MAASLEQPVLGGFSKTRLHRVMGAIAGSSSVETDNNPLALGQPLIQNPPRFPSDDSAPDDQLRFIKT